MQTTSYFRAVCALPVALYCGSAFSKTPQCAHPLATLPAAHSTQTAVSPPISWDAVAGAASYRLRLTSREPEGRTFATIDTVVIGTRFDPPQALTDGFAAVKVAVSSQCATGSPAAAPVEHRFYIDARPSCPVVGLVVDVQQMRIAWTPTPGASRYAVYAYDGLDGRHLFKLETREPRIAPPRTSELAVVAVRARCGEIRGQLSYVAY